jgi:hypothetical protein
MLSTSFLFKSETLNALITLHPNGRVVSEHGPGRYAFEASPGPELIMLEDHHRTIVKVPRSYELEDFELVIYFQLDEPLTIYVTEQKYKAFKCGRVYSVDYYMRYEDHTGTLTKLR